MESRIPKWLRPAVLGAIAVAVLVMVILTWIASNAIRDEFLLPEADEPPRNLEVLAIGGGRIVLDRTTLSEQEGVWGLVGENGYGQLSTIVALDEEKVDRGFLILTGEVAVGDLVRIDQYAYAGDPDTALAIPFDEVRIVGELGSYPAWFVAGDQDTWVIVVHGRGIDERRQSLRILPALVSEGIPVLAISVRNDWGSPVSASGLRSWGPEEWRDVEAAFAFGIERGADDFVVMAFGLGAEIAATFLHESDLITEVSGVILDSPVLDLEAAVGRYLGDRHFPGFVAAAARAVTRLRFGVEWDDLDQIARAGQFDLPILLMHGSADDFAPIETVEQFAALRADIVTYERFENAGHESLWNTARVRYEQAVRDFLTVVSGGTLEE